MKLSKTLAVALHRAMWTDMKTELGNNPSSELRVKFKESWIKEYFPKERVIHNCFLCEYAYQTGSRCDACPISWPEMGCAGHDFSYEKAPISDILALPEKGLKADNYEYHTFTRTWGLKEPTGDVVNDIKAVADLYYKSREGLLSEASGLPAYSTIEDHIKAIQKKAREEGYDTAKEYLAECSGIDQNELLFDHIRAIKEKAVEDADSNQYIAVKKYLAKESGLNRDRPVAAHIQAIQEKAVEDDSAKKASFYIAIAKASDAFKKYAEEQKAPIFHALAEASGLSAGNESVKAHISKIKDHERERIMDKIGEMLNDKSTGKTADS